MSEDKRPKDIIDLKKYDDPTGLAAKNLNYGLWLANNRSLLYKILIIILVSISSGFILYAGYNYFYFFTFGAEQAAILNQDTSGVNLADYRLQNNPLDLQLGSAKVISSNVGSDFIANIKNPNEKQFASFDFCFISGENKICGSSFILPNEEKDVLVINNPIKLATGQVKIELSNIRWQKLKAGEIPDWNVFKKDHLNLSISEPKFSTYDNGVSHLEFTIDNQSAYGYFEVPLNIIDSRGNEIVAINRYILKDLSSREKKTITLSWPEASNLGGSIKIIPDLNLVDTSIYKPYRSN